MAKRYEAVRQARLTGGWGGLGLALLVRQGMVAWIHACLTGTGTAPTPARDSSDKPNGGTAHPHPAPIPERWQRETVHVLASMTIGTLAEERT